MKWKVVSLFLDAPLIPEVADKDIGLEFDRKKQNKTKLFKQTKLLEDRDGRGQDWEQNCAI